MDKKISLVEMKISLFHENELNMYSDYNSKKWESVEKYQLLDPSNEFSSIFDYPVSPV